MAGVAPHDQTQSLYSHLLEASGRIQRLIFAVVISAIVWAFLVDDLFRVWLAQIPLAEGAGTLSIYSPYSWVDTRWTAVALLSLWTILPLAVREVRRFAYPGLLPRERRWLAFMSSSGMLIGTAILLFGWVWVFPRLVELAHNVGTPAGVGAQYDVISLFEMALALSAYLLILYLATSGLVIARLLGLVTSDPFDTFRVRLHFASVVALYLMTPPPLAGLFLVSALVLVTLSELFSSLAPLTGVARGRGAKTLFDKDGGDRRVMFVDCRCEGVCPKLGEDLLPESIGWLSVDALCLNEFEGEQLMERVVGERLSNVVISGCDATPIPGRLKQALAESGCDFSGLDLNSSAVCGDSASGELRDFALSLALSRAITPWSESSQVRWQQKALEGVKLPLKFVSSPSGNQPWGLRLKDDEVWIQYADALSADDPLRMVD